MDKIKLAIAFHESGHYVASFRLSESKSRYKISIFKRNGGLGRVEEESVLDDAPSDELKNEIVVFLSGYEAEIRLDPNLVNSAQVGAADDFKMASRLGSLLMEQEKDLPVFLKSMHFEAKALVEKNWKTITCLANELMKCQELDSDEADLVIMESDGDCDAGSALQQLRVIKNPV